MGRLKSIVVALGLVVELAGCVGPSALESQTRQNDGRLARMYFLREKGFVGSMGGTVASVDVKVDGRAVGTITNGTYFFVERPPGLHKLSSETKLSAAYEAEVKVEPGQTYYFGVGTPRTGAPGADLLYQALAGSSGEQMRATSPLAGAFAAAALFRLDPAAGAALIGQLKAL